MLTKFIKLLRVGVGSEIISPSLFSLKFYLSTSCPIHSKMTGKTWSMGPGTHKVPLSLFAENRQRLADKLQNGQIVFLEGGKNINHYNTDVEYVFQQEPFFTWICGVREPSCYFALDITSRKSILFVPRLPLAYGVWLGKLLSKDDFKELYGVDEVFFSEEMLDVLKKLKPEKLLTICGVNSDSKLPFNVVHFDGIDALPIDKDILCPIISELRAVKTPAEIDVMRYVAKVSSDAHKQVMLHVRPGMMEYECESVFLHHAYSKGGCRHISYTCICCSGENSAILHYGHAGSPNCKQIKDGDFCLFDMGGNYGGYAADITCSFPANGKFTDDQKLIYEAVLDACNAVLSKMRAGVSWVDMHLLANRVMLGKLIEAGILTGNVNDMIQAGLNKIFQPHGLGHLLGLDVHDVGGYLPGHPERPQHLTSLRTARTLLAGMVITVEPGCYFIDQLLDEALNNPKQSKFINASVLQRFRGMGGIRIEDDVLVLENGMENLTFVPRTVREIEDWMSKGANFSK